jgi:hypothetical protein
LIPNASIFVDKIGAFFIYKIIQLISIGANTCEGIVKIFLGTKVLLIFTYIYFFNSMAG